MDFAIHGGMRGNLMAVAYPWCKPRWTGIRLSAGRCFPVPAMPC